MIDYPITEEQLFDALRRAKSWRPLVRAQGLLDLHNIVMWLWSDSRCWHKYRYFMSATIFKREFPHGYPGLAQSEVDHGS